MSVLNCGLTQFLLLASPVSKQRLEMASLGNFITHKSPNGVTYECAFCPRICSTRFALKDHCKNTRLHPWCERCRHAFRDQEALDEHKRTSSAHYHVCRICKCDFLTKDLLATHISDEHYDCHVCDAYFDGAVDLILHRFDGHEVCEECDDLWFATRSECVAHVLTTHIGCERCLKCFPTPTLLRWHKEDDHSWCRECDTFFQGPYNRKMVRHGNCSTDSYSVGSFRLRAANLCIVLCPSIS